VSWGPGLSDCSESTYDGKRDMMLSRRAERDVPMDRHLPKCQPLTNCHATELSYRGRAMPSFFIFDCKVVRFMARRAAAPFGPPSIQPVSRSTATM